MNLNKYQFNFKLIPTAVFLIFFIAFISLGFWQLERAEEKEILNDAYSLRQSDGSINLNILDNLSDSSNLLWKKEMKW